MSDQVNIKGPAREELIGIWGGEIDMRVCIAGSGPPLLYFHPAGGLYWDEFLDRLAETHTVYAPELPGTTPGDPYAIHKVDNWTDLLLMYEELVRKLGLEQPVAIGQSMGGMTALDLAATFPALFARVVALAPTGLWREDAPVGIAELYAMPPDQVPAYIFHDPSTPAAGAMLALPEDPEEIPARVAQNVWALGCAGKFLWPIPDHGLRKRLHRISVPALILWGQQDRLVPPVYAQEFAEGISDCLSAVFENCGHIVQIEKLEETLEHVNNFVA
jgi:pimeloyl-ACP methyl ester carboxylesterase